MMNAQEFLDNIRPVPYLEQLEYDFKRRRKSLLIIAKTLCPSFVIDDDNRDIYENAIRYFAGDGECEWDLNKGIYLYGPIGVGKTLFFKIFRELANANCEFKNNFRRITISEMIDGVTRDGSKYFVSSGITFDDSLPMLIREDRSNHILLDDLGQSVDSVKYYGTNINIITDFIQRRYYAYTDYRLLTHITTNMVPKEIISEYGEFIASRMMEMFNIIPFKGKDKRK